MNAWGEHLTLDFIDCELDKMKDSDNIKNYVYELCDLIKMKRFGDCIVVNFGEDEKVAGYSMVQLIETSCITGHFADSSRRSFIDIFSCKKFLDKVEEIYVLTEKYFGGKLKDSNLLLRGKEN
jgi:S-adenosylmethionine/arginine decarboxylase-like enzyme